MNIAELDLEKAANAIVVLILGLAAAFGWNRARAKPAPPEMLEVAGALLSDKAADGIIAALDRNTAALNHNSETADDMREEIRAIGHSMTTLAVTMASKG